MILKLFPQSRTKTAVYQLPYPGLIVDPRPTENENYYKFKATVRGTILTLTRTDENKGWMKLRFRVYHEDEFFYPFTSDKYFFHGHEHERAPHNSKEVIFKHGIKIVPPLALHNCTSLVKVTLPNTITEIGASAFIRCTSLKSIRLPTNLEVIGNMAFAFCSSLELVYLHSSLKSIGNATFYHCSSLKLINIPENTDEIGAEVVAGCCQLMSTEMENSYNDTDQVDWLRNHRYNAFQKLCSSASVSSKEIREYISEHNGNEEIASVNDVSKMTALHVLAANPHVTGEMIDTYLELIPDAITAQDIYGKTAIHLLCSLPSLQRTSGNAIRAYFQRKNGIDAAYMKDADGKTPFDYLCLNQFEELPFLEEKSFSGLMAWWHDEECAGFNLFCR